MRPPKSKTLKLNLFPYFSVHWNTGSVNLSRCRENQEALAGRLWGDICKAPGKTLCIEWPNKTWLFDISIKCKLSYKLFL